MQPLARLSAVLVVAGLFASCDALPNLDPRIGSLCRVHSGNVLIFEWRGQRRPLPIAASVSDEQDAAWRARLGLPTRSSNPRFRLSHRISAVQQFADGWLVGTNYGEWGGGLFYVGEDRTPRELVQENVHALISTSRGIYALFGLTHMGIDEGRYRLISSSSTGPIVGAAQAFPGSPIDIAHDDGVTFVAGGFGDHFKRTWARAFAGGEPSPAVVRSPCR